MKNSDRKKFKEILDWVARNFKKTLSGIEYDDAWNDLSQYPIERIAEAAAHIRTYYKFHPTKADWMAALSATYRPEPLKELPEPPPDPLWLEHGNKFISLIMEIMRKEKPKDFPCPNDNPVAYEKAYKKYLLDGGIPKEIIDRAFPVNGDHG